MFYIYYCFLLPTSSLSVYSRSVKLGFQLSSRCISRLSVYFCLLFFFFSFCFPLLQNLLECLPIHLFSLWLLICKYSLFFFKFYVHYSIIMKWLSTMESDCCSVLNPCSTTKTRRELGQVISLPFSHLCMVIILFLLRGVIVLIKWDLVAFFFS